MRPGLLARAVEAMKLVKTPSLLALRRTASSAAPTAAAVVPTDRRDGVDRQPDVRILRTEKPSIETSLQGCNDVLRTLLRSPVPGRRAEGLSLLRRMLAPDSAFRPDSVTWSLLFSSLLKQSHPADNEALRLLVEMTEMGFFPSDTIQFTKFIDKICRSGGAASWAWDFVHAVMDAGGAVETPVFNALFTGLGRAGEFSRIDLLLAEMKSMGVRPNVVTFGILINCLCKSHRLDDAMKVLGEMTSPKLAVQPDTIILNTLINGFCKSGRLRKGLSLLNKMRKSHACEPDTATYNSLIDGLCKSGDIMKSYELLIKMEKEGVPPNVITLNTLVHGMCTHGRVGSALDFFRKKQVEWPEVKGNVATYSNLVGAFLHSNNIGQAMALFDEMLKEGHSPDSVMCFTVISGLTRVRRLDDAYHVALSMVNNGFQLDTKCYNILISGLCKKKRLDEADGMHREMCRTGLRPDAFTYNTLVAAFSKAGDFSKVEQLLNKMIDDGCKPSVVTYGALLNGYCKAGKLDEAMKIFRSMDASVVLPNTVIYNILIDSFCKNQRVDDAISLIDEMQEKGVALNVTTYNAILKGLRDCNMSDKALKLMDQMSAQRCTPDYVTMDILTEWLPVIGELERLKSFVQQMTPSHGQSPYHIVVSNS